MKFVIAPTAIADIAGILDWSEENFGPRTAVRYAMLIDAAIHDVADDPERSGSEPREELVAGWRTYHLHHSRKRIKPAAARIRQPRHLLLYRVTDADLVEIGRILHDSMELLLQLPDELHRPE